jgi:DNA-directed RNA polymerase subunit RPC12/RpoP
MQLHIQRILINYQIACMQRTRVLEQTLQGSCRNLTRLSSVVVTCSHCGEKFLKVESVHAVSCPRCGRTIFRQKELSGICDIDGIRVSKDQLMKCLNLDGKSAFECPKTKNEDSSWSQISDLDWNSNANK